MKQVGRTFVSSLAGGLGIAALMLAGIAPSVQAQASHPKMKITAAQANAVALKKFPGAVVGKTRLEDEEGKWQYGVMVRSGKTLREIMVNGKTGHIDSVEVTTDKKEAIEKRQDAAKAGKTHMTGIHKHPTIH